MSQPRDPQTSPAISVVIPSLNGRARLPETLDAISRQEVRGSVQVVVTDDGSSDGTAEFTRAFRTPWGRPDVVCHETPRGRAAACNAALARAAAPIVLILDDDMTLQPGAIEAHVRFHASRAAGGTAPPAAALGRIPPGVAPRETTFTRFLRKEEAHRELAIARCPEEVPFTFCLTGHFSAPRQALAETGGFDESITRYGFEDIELAWRLTRHGLRIHWLPEAVALHRTFETDLERMLERHREAGSVARQLSLRHREPEFAAFLRVGETEAIGLGEVPAGLAFLRLSHRLLLRGPVRRAVTSNAGFTLLRGAIRAGEAIGADRLAHLGYHVARDARYLQGYFEEAGR